ncbi:MAG: GxxExxY protein [Gammaproteobacteria bacterium]|nr:MAG: GxxExxY protein [Gammaproteobacteria bacterium]
MAVELERTGKYILDAAFRVHTALGPGLLESAYEACLAYELHAMGVPVQRQVEQAVVYWGQVIDVGYRLDLLVDEVVVEIKAVERLLPVHEAQLLSYLKMGNHRLGYLLNFNVLRLKDGIKRLVNKL